MDSRPRVSIGLPVYNGETYLASSIESVLGQSFGDLELVISDNASQDGTEEICRDFARRDARVRYLRQETNFGAAKNFNVVWERSRGDFFRWQAYDDLMLPECIAQQVAALDAHPDAVLCHTLVRRIAAGGDDMGVQPSLIEGATRKGQVERLRAMVLTWHDCTSIFGLMRREVLDGTPLFGAFSGADRALLAEIALRGSFVLIDEVLFLNRDHPQRFTRATWRDQEKERQYHAPLEKKRMLSNISVFKAYFAAVEKHVPDLGDRMRCHAAILAAMRMDHNLRPLLKDVLMLVSPALLRFVSASKRRLAGQR